MVNVLSKAHLQDMLSGAPEQVRRGGEHLAALLDAEYHKGRGASDSEEEVEHGQRGALGDEESRGDGDGEDEGEGEDEGDGEDEDEDEEARECALARVRRPSEGQARGGGAGDQPTVAQIQCALLAILQKPNLVPGFLQWYAEQAPGGAQRMAPVVKPPKKVLCASEAATLKNVLAGFKVRAEGVGGKRPLPFCDTLGGTASQEGGARASSAGGVKKARGRRRLGVSKDAASSASGASTQEQIDARTERANRRTPPPTQGDAGAQTQSAGSEHGGRSDKGADDHQQRVREDEVVLDPHVLAQHMPMLSSLPEPLLEALQDASRYKVLFGDSPAGGLVVTLMQVLSTAAYQTDMPCGTGTESLVYGGLVCQDLISKRPHDANAAALWSVKFILDLEGDRHRTASADAIHRLAQLAAVNQVLTEAACRVRSAEEMVSQPEGLRATWARWHAASKEGGGVLAIQARATGVAGWDWRIVKLVKPDGAPSNRLVEDMDKVRSKCA